MQSVPQPASRIVTLDYIRGVAVMGILVANLPAFGLPEPAYFSPLAWGGTDPADITVWFATFVLVEGKMRGLFSFLFGASMLLVIDRAQAAGESPAQVHLARMAALFAIGVAHLYLLWWGDILAHYALVGAIAYLFAGLRARWLVLLAGALLLWEWLTGIGATIAVFQSAARDTPVAIAVWNDFALAFGIPPRALLTAEIVATGGSWADGVAWRWTHALQPFSALGLYGMQTLSAVLLGMAAFRTGFVTGGWSRRNYTWIAATCLLACWAGYAALGAATLGHGFDQRWVVLGSIGASPPFRTLGYIGYAALLILLVRPGGRLSTNVVAVGQAAFTNYLGTSLLMSAIFAGWGLGLFGHLSRARLYLLIPLAWAIMLMWSPWWLARYRFGPLEWAWRSLARFSPQPMQRQIRVNEIYTQ